MKKQDFITELENYLDLTELTESSSLELSSLGILSVIALVDENFDMQFKAADLKAIKSVADLMNLIGMEKFSN